MEQWSRDDLDDIRRSDALRDFLTPTKSKKHGSKKRVLCPACMKNDAEIFNGQDGALLFKCWYCRAAGDVVSAVAFSRGISRVDAIPVALKMFRGSTPLQRVATRAAVKDDHHGQEPQAVTASEVAAYCQKARRWLTPRSPGFKYLEDRGLDPELMRDFYRLGYDERCTGMGSMKGGLPAVVMPFDGACSYFSARFLRPVGKMRFTQPSGSTGLRRPVFHEKQLYMDFDVVFICESEIDALSLAQAARSLSKYRVGVVATSGAGNYAGVLDALRQRMTDTMLVIGFDNDDAGISNSLDFWRALHEIGSNAHILDVSSMIGAWPTPEGKPSKDLNDVLRYHGDGALADIVQAFFDAPDVALIEPDDLRERLSGASEDGSRQG